MEGELKLEGTVTSQVHQLKGFSSELLLTWTLPQELILTCLRFAVHLTRHQDKVGRHTHSRKLLVPR